MKIIISPAKRMQVQNDWMPHRDLPVFLDRTERLMNLLKGMTPGDLRALWGCNDQIAQTNVKRLQHMDLGEQLSPVCLSVWR